MKVFMLEDDRGKKSITFTAFAIGTFVSLSKFALSDMTFWDYTFPHMSGMDAAAVIGSLGAIYWGRRDTKSKEDSELQQINE